MKGSWLYYYYLRRWWRFLLLGLALGALAGSAFYLLQDHKIQWDVKADFKVEGVREFRVVTINHGSEKSAIDQINSVRDELIAQGSGAVDMYFTSTVRRNSTSLWRPIVLGTFVGGALSVVWVFFWGDFLEYRRHRKHLESTGTQGPGI